MDDGDAVKGTLLTIDTEGIHTLRYWSVDKAGNTEAAQTATVKIDITKPDHRPHRHPGCERQGLEQHAGHRRLPV